MSIRNRKDDERPVMFYVGWAAMCLLPALFLMWPISYAARRLGAHIPNGLGLMLCLWVGIVAGSLAWMRWSARR